MGRPQKPRPYGRTAMIDSGLPFGLFADVIGCHAPYVDAVKFGWTTALFTQTLPDKIALLRSMAIDCWFGGTFFEIAWAEGKLSQYTAWMRQLGITHVEVSDGTVAIDATDRTRLIRALSAGFTVVSEVGKKADDAQPDPTEWVAAVQADLAAGAAWVILEGRESGTAGLYDGDGVLRHDLVGAILAAGIPLDRLIFEAPQKSQQVWLLRQLGPAINFGNIAWSDLISLETLRRGLRSDTTGRMAEHDVFHPSRRAS